MDGTLYHVIGSSLEGGVITGDYFYGTRDECESWIADYEEDEEFRDIRFSVETGAHCV